MIRRNLERANARVIAAERKDGGYWRPTDQRELVRAYRDLREAMLMEHPELRGDEDNEEEGDEVA